MFFIMGISQKEKRLDFDQVMICKCCGKYGHADVFMTYTYFMFFFIPLFKWNKQYYIRMRCCNSTAKIDSDLGKAIEHGSITEIDLDKIQFGCHENSIKRCSNCGFASTESDYVYCPKCGNKL
jgi:hypothetical protein